RVLTCSSHSRVTSTSPATLTRGSAASIRPSPPVPGRSRVGTATSPATSSTATRCSQRLHPRHETSPTTARPASTAPAYQGSTAYRQPSTRPAAPSSPSSPSTKTGQRRLAGPRPGSGAGIVQQPARFGDRAGQRGVDGERVGHLVHGEPVADRQGDREDQLAG